LSEARVFFLDFFVIKLAIFGDVRDWVKTRSPECVRHRDANAERLKGSYRFFFLRTSYIVLTFQK